MSSYLKINVLSLKLKIVPWESRYWSTPVPLGIDRVSNLLPNICEVWGCATIMALHYYYCLTQQAMHINYHQWDSLRNMITAETIYELIPILSSLLQGTSASDSLVIVEITIKKDLLNSFLCLIPCVISSGWLKISNFLLVDCLKYVLHSGST